MTATALSERHELAHRSSDGIEVTLFWSKPSERVTIAVVDTHSEEALEFDVDGAPPSTLSTIPTRTPPRSTPTTAPSRVTPQTR